MTHKRLELRASEHGTSIEAEARAILDSAVARPNLVDIAERLFGPAGDDVMLDIPPPLPMRLPRLSPRGGAHIRGGVTRISSQGVIGGTCRPVIRVKSNFTLVASAGA